MSIFLMVYFSVYGGLHVYGFLKVKRGLDLGTGATVGTAIFMICMVLAPVALRICEKHGLELGARLLAYVGYTWMSIIFLFVSAALVLDCYRLLLFLGGHVLQTDLSGIKLSARHVFITAFVAAVGITVYGAFEASDIKTEHLVIRTSKLPENIGRLKIVQISDVHLGLMVREKRLQWILDQVAAAKPDILVSTGDLVDGQIERFEGLDSMLRNIPTKYGKFAITGNHEFYAGLSRSLEFIKKAGFTVLRGHGLEVAGLINIAGIDDDAGQRRGLVREVSEKAVLAGLSREKFTLLLKHRPVVDDDALGLFDLQLSGHTHKGQIFPFSLVTKFYYPHQAGFLQLEKGSGLYVSRGSGTWGPSVRFLSAPEVTLIELIQADGNN